MSDFSELCPLFSTGVYGELTIGTITFSGLSTTMNALGGAKTKAAHPGSLKFQRSVIVTNVWAKKIVTPGTANILVAMRLAATGTAAMTAFASLKMSTTATVHCVNRYRKMTQAANKNFNAADVLGFANKTAKTDGGQFEFIVRYKER